MRPLSGRIALAAEGVEYAYDGDAAALEAVDFHAIQGELVAVVGANGSGKTTLMKLLIRLLEPAKGRVLLDGVDISKIAPAQFHARVGMVFQNPVDQLFAPTVEQDVAFGPGNLNLPPDEVRRRVDEALAQMNLQHLRDRPIHHLSFGEQKRTCVAGVLAMKPSVMVLDEPTAGLDVQGELAMMDLLLGLNRKEGITIILATHSVDLLPMLADRIYVLRRGMVQRHGTPHEIFADHASAAEANLRLPLIAQLFHELAVHHGFKSGTLPLTIEEARRQVIEWFESRQGRLVATKDAQ